MSVGGLRSGECIGVRCDRDAMEASVPGGTRQYIRIPVPSVRVVKALFLPLAQRQRVPMQKGLLGGGTGMSCGGDGRGGLGSEKRTNKEPWHRPADLHGSRFLRAPL